MRFEESASSVVKVTAYIQTKHYGRISDILQCDKYQQLNMMIDNR